jgi:hypothetical protein
LAIEGRTLKLNNVFMFRGGAPVAHIACIFECPECTPPGCNNNNNNNCNFGPPAIKEMGILFISIIIHPVNLG